MLAQHPRVLHASPQKRLGQDQSHHVRSINLLHSSDECKRDKVEEHLSTWAGTRCHFGFGQRLPPKVIHPYSLGHP